MLKSKIVLLPILAFLLAPVIAFGEAGREPVYGPPCGRLIQVSCQEIITQYYQNNLKAPDGYEIVDFKDVTPKPYAKRLQLTFTYFLKSQDGKRLCPGGLVSVWSNHFSECIDNLDTGETPEQVESRLRTNCLTSATAPSRLRHEIPKFCGFPL